MPGGRRRRGGRRGRTWLMPPRLGRTRPGCRACARRCRRCRSSLGPRTCCTTAVRPPTFHSARPRVSWPTMLASGPVRPKCATAASSWSGAWRRMIWVAESASSPAAILAGGGAVVGLGDEVRRAVGDAEVRDAVGAAELEAGLEVAGGVAVAEQRPGFVEDLHPLGAGAGHELLEPSGGGDHDERERVGVDRHRGEVEHDAGAVPSQRDGGAPVEHAAERAGQELVERERDGAGLPRRGRARWCGAGRSSSSVGLATSRATSASVGSARGAVVSCSTAANTTASSSCVRLRSSTVPTSAVHISARRRICLSAGSCSAAGPGASGLMVAVPPGLSFTRGEPEVFGEGGVLALGVGDRGPPSAGAGAVDGGLSPQEALDERGLAVAGFAEDPTVRVGDQPGGVGLEGVPAELAAARRGGRVRRRCLGARRSLGPRTGRCSRRGRWCPGGSGAAATGGS